jgi:allantoicase
LSRAVPPTAPTPDSQHDPAAHAFTRLIDLAQERLGGRAEAASDEFFAEKENLLKPGRGVFIPEKFTENGKWMDGWETRRKRVPGHDWCVVKLGAPGIVHGVDVDTNHFLGNYPEFCAIDALAHDGEVPADALAGPNAPWRELLPISPLRGGVPNCFPVESRDRWTHLRLRIYPDGGVARLRVHGEVRADWERLLKAGEPVDLAALENGGEVLVVADMFFGHRENLIMPGRAANMGEGWETRRRRGPGNDWSIVKLARPGVLQQIEVDTNHFKGNFPESCSLEGTVLEGACPAAAGGHPSQCPPELLASRTVAWTEIVHRTKLQAHTRHYFDGAQIRAAGPFTHVRLSIYPDGGVSRLRLFGRPAELRAESRAEHRG